MVDPLNADVDLLFLDPSDIPTLDCLPGVSAEGGGGVEEEEEELEWLSNKESFPALETSFEACSAAGVAAAAAGPPRAPARPRSSRPRRRRRVLSVFQRDAVAERRRNKGRERRRCRHCEAEETPQWRAGPEGPKTLCNACGVRFKSGRLLPEYRPAASPTFSAALHSNSHRRVLELRRRPAARR